MRFVGRRLPLTLLLLALLAPIPGTARAPVTGITVATDRADYVYSPSLVVTATATIVYAPPSFSQVNDAVLVQWYNETWVPIGTPEYVPKTVVSSGVAQAVARWGPPGLGIYRVNMTSNATNGMPPPFTGTASFTLWETLPSQDSGALPVLLGILLFAGGALGVAVVLRRREPGPEPMELAEPLLPEGPPVLEPGASYAILGEKPHGAFRRLARELAAGAPGLCIARIRPQDARHRYGLGEVPGYWLSRTFGPDMLNPTNLGAIVELVRKHASQRPGLRVVVDGIEYLYTQNDFGKVVKFVNVLTDVVAEHKAVLLLPIDPATLDPDRLAILTRDLRPW